MRINKIKNMNRNIISGLIFRTISIIFPFIIRTIIIKKLSSEYLGLNSLFTSVLQALNLMELGLGSALVFNMYEHVATDNKEKLANYMGFFKKCYRIIGLTILIAGLIIMPYIKHFIKGSYPQEINIYVIYAIYLSNTVISYLLFAYKNSIALAYQKTNIETTITAITHTCMYIIQILVLMIMKDYYLYIIALPFFTIIKNLLISRTIKKEFNGINPHGDITKEEKNKIINNIKALFGHQIAFTIINSADNIILSKMLGLNNLAIYNNYYYIMSALINIMTIIFNSIQAGIGNNIILDEKEVVYKNFKRFRLFVYTIVCICSTCMMSTYTIFMKIWMGGEYLLPFYSVLAFSFGFYITQIRRVVTTYKNAAGLWKQDIYKPYIWIILDIILDILLIPKIGVTGAIIATSTSAIIVAIPKETYVLFKNVFNRNCMTHFKYMISEFIIYLFSMSIVYLLIKIEFNHKYLYLIYCILVGIVVPTIINILIKCRTEEYKWIVERTKGIIRSKLKREF